MVYNGIKRGNLLYRDFCWRAMFLEANKSPKKKIYENFGETLETVCNREVSVPRGSTVPMSTIKTSGAIS